MKLGPADVVSSRKRAAAGPGRCGVAEPGDNGDAVVGVGTAANVDEARVSVLALSPGGEEGWGLSRGCG